jgi:hypothetical protein
VISNDVAFAGRSPSMSKTRHTLNSLASVLGRRLIKTGAQPPFSRPEHA